MAHTDRMDAQAEEAVARQIGYRLTSIPSAAIRPEVAAALMPAPGGQPPSMQESFRVFGLRSEALAPGFQVPPQGLRLGDYVEDTGQWHHQIAARPAPGAAPGTAGSAIGFARSCPASEEERDRVCHEQLVAQMAVTVGGERLARKVDRAIQYLDSLGDDTLPGDPVVRLLEVPACFLTALYIQGGEDAPSPYEWVTVVDVAPGAERSGTFEYRKLYEPGDFLLRLRQGPCAQPFPPAPGSP